MRGRREFEARAAPSPARPEAPFSGLTGVGGSAVMVPALTGQLELSPHGAHATSLSGICFVAASGVIRYWHAGNIEWSPAATLLPGDIVGTYAATKTLVYVPSRQLRLPDASASAMVG